MRGPWEALSSLARKLTTHFEIVTRRRALWNAITSESRTTCGKSGQLDPDWYSSVYPREKPDTHTHTRAYIYIYIHITWLNKILDSLTLPISLPSIEPSAFHDEILMTLSTRFDPRPIFFNPISVINSEPRYPFLD